MGLADMATIGVVMTYTAQENGITVSVDDTLTVGLQDTSRHYLKVQLPLFL
jgi:hypothetical protein